MEVHSNKEVDENSILTAAELTRSFGADQSLTEILNISTENPSHLYWVPASQHPEIAPNEFENYVQALRTNVEKKKGNVKRRRSILSVSFTADDIISKTATVSTDNDNEQANGRQSALEALENKKQPSPSSLGRANSLINKENHANEYNNQLDEKMAKTRKEKLRRSISLHFTNPSGNYYYR
ncbi:hypothetical protein BJ944DRAFT_108766 [Cunninghamella echinulata]|nr:hypothetical protein BJ944DRAFT_108766 [Cunninghamella echinulata]